MNEKIEIVEQNKVGKFLSNNTNLELNNINCQMETSKNSSADKKQFIS